MADDGRNGGVSPGFALWLMGPTSSGKSTLAKLLQARLIENGISAVNYDGDEVRDFFGESLDFAPADRLRVVSTLAHLTNKATAAGVNVIVSALTANEDARQLVQDTISNLIVGYVKCSIETCAARDPKGLYAQAQSGEIDTLIGVNSEYLPPENPDITLETEARSPEQVVDEIVEYLRRINRLN